MRLAEAIRLGSMLKPQEFGKERGSVSVHRAGDVLGLASRQTSCAFAAAMDAQPCEVRRLDPAIPLHHLRDGMATKPGYVLMPPTEWSVLFVVVHCPACMHENEQTVLKQIAHLNDDHRWTRERIADWIDLIEGHDVPAKAEQEVAAP